VFAAAALGATLLWSTLFSTVGAMATDMPMDTVVLGALDKVTGRVNTIRGPVGSTLTFGRLQIVARTCLTHPPEEPPENSAFLEISEKKPKDKTPTQVFTGWMFSSDPAISAMDHPVYDVWVLACEPASKKPSISH
jgi:hypothetical protein